ELDSTHRHIWNGITKQFTRYGQVYREFDSNWDWMHHGEGYVSFYPFGLADPHDDLFRDRSVRFAAMYTGEDSESPNYDPKLRLIRAVMTGSRGPKMEWNKRDWTPTNANLAYYHLPYDDIPGVDSSTGWINDHPDNDQFARIVKAMSDRMARGDVPINMTVTPLIANAYLYTGDDKYVDWVEDYVGAWVERTRENGGITPDNVGLSGKVGEYNDGHWWGGYYGWRWVRGGLDVVLASYTAAKAAVLLTGDRKWFDLPRSQLDVMSEKGKAHKRGWSIPIRYDDKAGWHHFTTEPGYPAANLWAVTQSPKDWAHVERLAAARGGPKGDEDLEWVFYLRGKNPNYPAEALRRELGFVQKKLELILAEHGDPETWFDAKWLSLDPVDVDTLVRLMLGAPPVQKRGEMLHSYVRYFDMERREPGLPEGVAALVTNIADTRVSLELVNTNLLESRKVAIQAGAYGEHRFGAVKTGDKEVDVGANWLAVQLAPGAGARLQIEIERWANPGSYRFPWEETR
ncbi:MAG: hypothetical protein KDC27_21995, partial [Acidobacteria bacterium]|nr:hypothetical protein [Acidobacteriota bacterium]